MNVLKVLFVCIFMMTVCVEAKEDVSRLLYWGTNSDSPSNDAIIGIDRLGRRCPLKITRKGFSTIPDEFDAYVIQDESGRHIEKVESFCLPKTSLDLQTSSLFPNNPYIDQEIWEAVRPYLLPDSHEMAEKIEKIFKKSDMATIILVKDGYKAFGFKLVAKGKFTKVRVLKHKKIKGYLFKIYPNSAKDKVIWTRQLKRIRGANLIRDLIEECQGAAYCKVPKKWLIPLPPGVIDYGKEKQNYFCLLVEDMNLLKKKKIKKRWASDKVSHGHLEAFYYVCKHGKLWDSISINNSPIAKDGKIAFIDTEHFLSWIDPPFMRMLDFLSEENGVFWKNLVENDSN